MKRLIPGMFSSISDMEFITNTSDAESAENESGVRMDAEDKRKDPGLPDIDSDNRLPS